MTYKVGELLKFKVNDQGFLDPLGTFVGQHTVLIICTMLNSKDYMVTGQEANNPLQVLTKATANRFINFYVKSRYECAPNLIDYEGCAFTWFGERELNRLLVSKESIIVAPQKLGHRCSDVYCNEYNEWAEPNMPDGSYKCYLCRNRI